MLCIRHEKHIVKYAYIAVHIMKKTVRKYINSSE